MPDLIDREELIELLVISVKNCQLESNAQLCILAIKDYIEQMPSQSLSDEITDKMKQAAASFPMYTRESFHDWCCRLYTVMQEAREPVSDNQNDYKSPEIEAMKELANNLCNSIKDKDVVK